ncbi:MAG: hypothetical protein WCO86_05365 [Planctomycetota bacterium]
MVTHGCGYGISVIELLEFESAVCCKAECWRIIRDLQSERAKLAVGSWQLAVGSPLETGNWKLETES